MPNHRDVAIPSDYNIKKKATEKMSTYVDLQIECQRLWNKKVEVIPVIIGATGIVDKNIKKYVGRIPGCHNIYSLQRSAILGTAHILRKVLSIKPDQVTGQGIQHHVSPRCRDYTQQNMVKSKILKNERQKAPPIIIMRRRSCHGAVVECRTRDLEVPGSNPGVAKKKISHRSNQNNTTTNPSAPELNT